jgi:hypothetical protein
MASQETKQLDEIIASRRAIILGGGAAALAAAFLPATAKAATTVSTFTDADILNFALNLEYLRPTSTTWRPSAPRSTRPMPR